MKGPTRATRRRAPRQGAEKQKVSAGLLGSIPPLIAPIPVPIPSAPPASPEQQLMEAVSFLAHQLSITFAGQERDANTMRRRYVLALLHFAKFVERTGMGREIASDLETLAMALHERQHGTEHPIFAKPSHSARTGRPDVWRIRAELVCAYNYLRECDGYSRAAALQIIKKQEDAFKGILQGKASLTGSLLQWCKTFGRGNAPKATQNYFNELMGVSCVLQRAAARGGRFRL